MGGRWEEEDDIGGSGELTDVVSPLGMRAQNNFEK